MQTSNSRNVYKYIGLDAVQCGGVFGKLEDMRVHAQYTGQALTIYL